VCPKTDSPIRQYRHQNKRGKRKSGGNAGSLVASDRCKGGELRQFDDPFKTICVESFGELLTIRKLGRNGLLFFSGNRTSSRTPPIRQSIFAS